MSEGPLRAPGLGGWCCPTPALAGSLLGRTGTFGPPGHRPPRGPAPNPAASTAGMKPRSPGGPESIPFPFATTRLPLGKHIWELRYKRPKLQPAAPRRKEAGKARASSARARPDPRGRAKPGASGRARSMRLRLERCWPAGEKASWVWDRAAVPNHPASPITKQFWPPQSHRGAPGAPRSEKKQTQPLGNRHLL